MFAQSLLDDLRSGRGSPCGVREETFVRDLVDQLPAPAAQLSQHLADTFGEVLPHLFLAHIRAVDLHENAEAIGEDEPASWQEVAEDLCPLAPIHVGAEVVVSDSDHV